MRCNSKHNGNASNQYVPLTNVIGLQDRLVTEWSSSTVNTDNETVAGTHTTIVKPQESDDLSYLIVKDRIKQAFKKRS